MNPNPNHYQISNNHDSFNVTTITNHTTIIEDERRQILSWLSPLKSWKRHSDVAGARARGVGDWVLKTAEFQAWQRDADGQPSDAVLFCHGVPGAGKTFVWWGSQFQTHSNHCLFLSAPWLSIPYAMRLRVRMWQSLVYTAITAAKKSKRQQE